MPGAVCLPHLGVSRQGMEILVPVSKEYVHIYTFVHPLCMSFNRKFAMRSTFAGAFMIQGEFRNGLKKVAENEIKYGVRVVQS